MLANYVQKYFKANIYPSEHHFLAFHKILVDREDLVFLEHHRPLAHPVKRIS